MAGTDWLSIDAKSCTPHELVSLIEQLDGSEHQGLRNELQRELVGRLRSKGLSNARIIDVLIQGVGRATTRDQIAKKWAQALDVTVQEFKRIARGN